MVGGLGKLYRRPLFEVAITHKPLQAKYKQLPEGGSLLATNLDHQKLGRATTLWVGVQYAAHLIWERVRMSEQ